MSGASRRVREYYERNTPRFLRYGEGRRTASLHRAVWIDGTRTRDAAMHAVDQLVLEQIRAIGARFTVDLGCGVGGTIAFLAAETPEGRFGGMTLSGVQARKAGSLLSRLGLEGRCRVIEADYLDPSAYERLALWAARDPGGPFLDLAFAIESFLHAPDPGLLLSQVARRLRSGGRLILCDDFAAALARGDLERRRLEEFRSGWLAFSLLRRPELERLSASSGLRLIECRDLTPYLELGRLRDRVLRAAVAAGRALRVRSPAWSSLVGGDALQRCLRSGLVRYLFVVLAR